MKRKLLSLTAALLCAIGSWADTDYTSKVDNAQAGWTGASGIYSNAKAADQTQLNIVEKYWGESSVSGAGVSIFSQTVSELPNGTYMVVFYATANNARCPEANGGIQSNASDLVYVYAGSDKAHKTYVTSRKVDSYTYPDEYIVSGAVVTDGTLELGMYAEKTGTQWQTIQVKALIRIDEAADNNGIDFTKAIINSSIYNTKQTEAPYGWTFYEREAGNDNRTAGTGNTCLELWSNSDMKVDVYQQISNLSKGAYKVTANCHDQNGTGKYSVYGYNPANRERATGTINVSGDGAENYADITTDYLLVTDGRINIGLIGSSSASWITGDDFRLTYYGNAVKVYSPTSFTSGSSATADTWYEFTVAPAGWYRINSSADATLYYTQNNSDDADATASKALTAGTNTIINLTAGSFFFKSSDASTIKIEAANGVLQDGDDITLLITNPSFETGNKTGWTDDTASDGSDDGKDDKIDILSSDALSGKDGTYFAERWWHNSNMDIYQTTPTIPAGFYRITARAKAESGNDIKIYAKAGSSDEVTTSVSDATDYSVEVYLSSAGSVKLGLKGHHITKTHVAFDNFRLTFLGNPYPALKDAIDDAEANYKLGFENGEYAPYNNKDALTALANANSIYDAKTAIAAEVGEATTTLTGATWTANPTEVNAFYDGDFSECAEDNDSPLDYTPAGWTASTNMRMMLKNSETYPGLSDASATSAMMSWTGGTNYGETTGYTMPLNANTIYELKFKAAGWNNETRSGMTVSVLNSSDGLAATDLGTPDRDIKGNESNTPGMTSYTKRFKTGAAGNYVFHIQSGNNFVLTDLELKKATATVLNENDGYTPEDGLLTNVTLNRTIKADKWNTFCVPFDMSSEEITDKFGSGANVKELTGATPNGDNYTLTFGNASSIVAGKPYMVKVPSEVTSISLTDKTISSSNTPTTVGGVTFTGVYTSGKAPLNSFIISDNVFYMVDKENTVNLKAFRGYITVGSGSSVKALNFVFDDNADGISTIENGQLIIDNAPIYNLAGQRIQKMQKGINIVNGKKIMK